MIASIKKSIVWLLPAIKYFLYWLLVTVAAVLMVFIIGFAVLEAAGPQTDDIELAMGNSWLIAAALTCAHVLLLLLFWRRRYTRNWIEFGYTYGEEFSSGKLALWAVVGAVGCLLLDIMVQEYVPIPVESDLDKWFELLFDNPLGILSICLIGPLAEEAIFRGAIERRLLETNWNPWFAIVISALLFAVAHGNYAQGATAIIMGCFSGWIYYRTRSIWPTFLIHAVNNTTAVIAALSLPESMVDEASETLGVPLSIGIPLIVLSLILLYISVKHIGKITNDRTPISALGTDHDVLPPPFTNEYIKQDVPVGEPLAENAETGVTAEGFDSEIHHMEP
jgi:membrane protease YdiL (CAAX protease family)